VKGPRFITVKLTVLQAQAVVDALNACTFGTLDDDWLDSFASESERARFVERADKACQTIRHALRDSTWVKGDGT
jgi:hypothetical protein